MRVSTLAIRMLVGVPIGTALGMAVHKHSARDIQSTYLYQVIYNLSYELSFDIASDSNLFYAVQLPNISRVLGTLLGLPRRSHNIEHG